MYNNVISIIFSSAHQNDVIPCAKLADIINNFIIIIIIIINFINIISIIIILL